MARPALRQQHERRQVELIAIVEDVVNGERILACTVSVKGDLRPTRTTIPLRSWEITLDQIAHWLQSLEYEKC